MNFEATVGSARKTCGKHKKHFVIYDVTFDRSGMENNPEEDGLSKMFRNPFKLCSRTNERREFTFHLYILHSIGYHLVKLKTIGYHLVSHMMHP